jgi:hypothetical protein
VQENDPISLPQERKDDHGKFSFFLPQTKGKYLLTPFAGEDKPQILSFALLPSPSP